MIGRKPATEMKQSGIEVGARRCPAEPMYCIVNHTIPIPPRASHESTTFKVSPYSQILKRQECELRKNSIKNTRINGEVQKELSRIIQNEIKDPRIAPMTSVVAAEVAPDLKTCKAYISVFGDEKAAADTLAGLKSAESYIRRQLARTVNLRNTPEIRFILDQSIAYGVRISHLIDQVIDTDEKKRNSADQNTMEEWAE